MTRWGEAGTHARALGRLFVETAPALVAPAVLSVLLLLWHATHAGLDATWVLVGLSPALVFWALFVPLAYPHVLAEVSDSHTRETDDDPPEWRFGVDRFD